MKLMIYFIVFVIFFLIFTRYLENTSIFYPSRTIRFTPADIGLSFEDVFLKTEDGVVIHGWFIPAGRPKGTLIFLHGNAGNIGDRLEKIQLFNSMGLNIFIVDYRGYGKSKGHPSEEGVYKDARAVYDYLALRADIDPGRIFAYGASLGGAVAIDLAMKRKLAGLMVDSTFSSAVDMAKRMYPFIPSFLVRSKFDSISKVRDMRIPKLFIHSPEDDIVPFEMGDKLYQAAAGPKVFLETAGDHNNGYIDSRGRMREGIETFLKQWGTAQ
jgi:fermentation-respiration switch protein FrsA (DUF1100 family)